MAAYYLVLTPYGNVLGRGPGTLTASADSAFPNTKLYDGSAQEIFQFASLGADALIKKDTNLLTNPTFATSAANWTNGGSNIRYQDITCQPGEQLQFRMVTTNTATVTVQSLRSGNFLIATQSVNGSLTFQVTVDSVALNKGHQAVPLRITVNDYTRFTSLYMIPAVNFAGVFGHNFGAVRCALDYSDDDATYTLASEMVPDQPSFYCYLGDTPLFKRYWRMKTVGTNFETIYISELVIGHAAKMDPAPMWDWKEIDDWPSQVHTNDAGHRTVTVMTSRPQRTLKLEFAPTNAFDTPEKLTAMRKLMWERSKAGSYPAVVVVRSTRPGVVLGRFQQSLDVTQMIPNAQKVGLDVVGLPFPLVGTVNT